MLGVLGGMGPLATADFLEKFVRLNPAEKDQDHPQVVVFSNPHIPDRIGPILRGDPESPLPALIESARKLQDFGATVLTMPCHTAHYWHSQVTAALVIPFLHIADATCEELREESRTVALLSTRATLTAGFYQQRFEAMGLPYVVPGDEEMERFVLPAIAAVKRDEVDVATQLFTRVSDRLFRQGVEVLVLACTELPVILQQVDTSLRQSCVDPTYALAKMCVTSRHLGAPRPTL